MNMDAGASSSSFTTPPKKYDVFISFRGEDTRNNFTSHLYAALRRKQIKAYIDENDLKRGEEISPALLRAIQESKLCLIVLSKNYASSTWCLDELAYILKCKRKQRQEILPIFFKVDPSHVREQKESYATAFVELEERFKDKMDKVQAWRDALKEVGSLSGWASSEGRCESKLVERVVQEIIKRLSHTASSSNNLKGLVGIDKHINQIRSLLCIGSLDVRIIGIWGMGGIGKTTLARAVFDQFSSQFDACSFLENVREEAERHGPSHLEKKLFPELLEEENLNPSKLPFAKDRLRRKKVLIVFDDVNDPEQLEQLVGDWFGLESRIIVTSRDKQVLRNIEVHGTYELGELSRNEALELFCLHAFKGNSPTENEIELSQRVVDCAGGVPLALKVLGRHLYCKSAEVWESASKKLRKFSNKDIDKVLRISYDALDDTEKCIFLDIACSFKGKSKDFVENILGCDLYATSGIEVLIDKSLITLDRGNMLGMHDLLQHMGFEIVRVQSSRLWRADDISRALKYNTGLEAIEGISLNTTNVTEEFHLSPTTFSKMYQFPDKLTYLRWDGYPLQSLSTNFTAKNLVELDMRCSKLEKLWDGIVGRFRFCWAGSEIPRWIIHQSEGSSICINLPPQWHNRTYLGLAICLVLEDVGEHDYIPYDFTYECHYASPNGYSLSWNGSSHTDGIYKSDVYTICQDCGLQRKGLLHRCEHGTVSCEHVALLYENTAFLNKYGTNRFTSTTATLSLSFWPYGEFVKVKKCGVHLMYAQEAEKFGFVQPCDWAERQSNIMLRYKKPDGEEAIGIDSGTQSEPSEEEVSDIGDFLDSDTESEPSEKEVSDIDSGTEEPLPKRIRAAQND